MSPKKLLVLSAVVVALFAFILLFERKMPSTEERARKGDLYWDIPQDHIAKISLTRGAETLEFERAGDAGWRMLKPVKYPADTFAVGSMASDLAEMKRASAEDVTGAKPSDYGLDKPEAKATIVWSDASDPKTSNTRSIEFGSAIPGTDTVAARVAGTEKVLFVPASVLASVRKSADDFESRDVFGSSAADAARLEILRGRGKLAFTKKDGSWWLAEPLADLAESSEVDHLTSQLAGLRAKEFLRGPQELSSLGLEPPLFHVVLTDAKGGATAVDFGATRSDGNSLYARRDGQVLTVDRDIADELSKEVEAFRGHTVLGFRRGDVVGVEAAFPKSAYALVQKDGGWTADGKPMLAAAADDVLTALLDVKTGDFVDESQVKALGKPSATVTVRPKAGAPWALSLYPRDSGLVARAAPRPGGFVVDADAMEKLEAAFRRATTAPTPAARPKS